MDKMSKDTKITIALGVVAVGLLIAIFVICSGKSKFQASSQMMKTTEKPKPGSKTHQITPDSVVVVFATWCGHCKSFKPEMEKAAAKSSKIVLLDEATPEGKAFVTKYQVKGYPSVLTGSGKPLNVDRTADSLLKAAGEK